MNDPKGFFASLLDFSFSEFITIKLVKVLYIIFLVLVALGFVAGVIAALIRMFSRGGFLPGLGMLCAAPIAALIYVILARLWTELVIVVFRIAENTTELVEQGRAKAKNE